MGLRRLRGRLDQVQGHANASLAAADDLLADLRDGVGITLRLDGDKLRELLRDLMYGKQSGPIDLPLTVVIDPTVDKGT
jgi:hypothetical protein